MASVCSLYIHFTEAGYSSKAAKWICLRKTPVNLNQMLHYIPNSVWITEDTCSSAFHLWCLLKWHLHRKPIKGRQSLQTFPIWSHRKRLYLTSFYLKDIHSFQGINLMGIQLTHTWLTYCNKAARCEFGDLKNGLIHDRIVCGINDDPVRAQLLREAELTLESCLDICRAAEISSASSKFWTNKRQCTW